MNILRKIVSKILLFNELFVFLINLLIFIVSLWLAFLLTFGIKLFLENFNYVDYLYCLVIVVFIKFVVFYLFKTFHGIWRYVSLTDLVKLFFANCLGSFIIIILSLHFSVDYVNLLTTRVIVSDFFFCLFFSAGIRVFVRMCREFINRNVNTNQSYSTVKKVLLVGGLKFSDSLLHSFTHNNVNRDVVGLLTEETIVGRTIRNIPIYKHIDRAGKLADALMVDEIMLLPPYTSPLEINKILELLEFEKVKCSLRMVPAYSDIATGDIDISLIKKVEIDDLLERFPVTFNDSHVSESINGKNIMVTGAGGSIGSELVRQIIKYKPKLIVLFDLSEYNLYQIELEVDSLDIKKISVKYVLGSAYDQDAVLNSMVENEIDEVFHAAAVKHVPLIEKNIPIALKTNVLGTAIVADCCEKAGVAKMVMVSTDKAVNPSSIMGATKRLAERVVIERPSGKTEFVIVRFGNVLGSSGSVIPLFKKQIKNGGPVTVTSKSMTRFFMSIPEAVSLVLQASSIGKNGNIMVLQMGQSVNIYNMARKLIELSGFRPGIDIKIEITGVRPGEKEYEEILTKKEQVNNTIFEKIYISKFVSLGYEPIDIHEVKKLISKRNSEEIRAYIKSNIPEVMF